jgi:CheY-like chemotaxis protein
MSKIRILWADDEIDILKPQLFFLEKKGYDVETVTNGHDAIERVKESSDIDVIFLDESMPGITGLETLERIKEINANIPVVMITKNEAEDIMEQAIGSRIDDYLIKPVNPNQILLSLKKITDNKRLVSEKTSSDYQQEFRKILLEINETSDIESWVDIYKKIISWELKLDESESDEMNDILSMQKNEANKEFSKYVLKNYEDWVNDDSVTMSHNLLKHKLLKHVTGEKPVVFLLLDNLRFDQWKILEPKILELFKVDSEEYFMSILPTSTQYSRNAIFAGLKPYDIQKKYPDKWLHDFEQGGKNNHEEAFMQMQLDRILRRDVKMEYHKITKNSAAKVLAENALNFMNNDLTVVVYNFIDMLSHARTEMEVLKELASDEKAYRSLTRSWFANSPLWTTLQKLSEKDIKLVIATDHGTIRVKNPSKVLADRNTTTNLRYKMGKNLNYVNSDVLEIKDPKQVGLPSPNMSSRFIFAKEDKFFLYPNNYNHFNNMYSDTFQHGGISLEEMICPYIELSSR